MDSCNLAVSIASLFVSTVNTTLSIKRRSNHLEKSFYSNFTFVSSLVTLRVLCNFFKQLIVFPKKYFHSPYRISITSCESISTTDFVLSLTSDLALYTAVCMYCLCLCKKVKRCLLHYLYGRLLYLTVYYVNFSLLFLISFLSLLSHVEHYIPSIHFFLFHHISLAPSTWADLFSLMIFHPRYFIAVTFFINATTNVIVNVIIALVVRNVTTILTTQYNNRSCEAAAKSLVVFLSISTCAVLSGAGMYNIAVFGTEKEAPEHSLVVLMSLSKFALPLHFTWELLYQPHLAKVLTTAEAHHVLSNESVVPLQCNKPSHTLCLLV